MVSIPGYVPSEPSQLPLGVQMVEYTVCKALEHTTDKPKRSRGQRTDKSISGVLRHPD